MRSGHANEGRDLSGIENLTNLKALNISKTEISNLKPLLNFIKNGLELTWIEKLYPRNLEIVLYDNPLIKPPIEIVTAGNQAVINYFDSLSDGEETVHEAPTTTRLVPCQNRTSQ